MGASGCNSNLALNSPQPPPMPAESHPPLYNLLPWSFALQDFTILVLLGAGCLSLGLELLVNRKAGGESSWIEGASILAAGAGAC